MHYVPESASEFFQERPKSAQAEEAALADVAGLYLLTAVVGLLLAADFVLGWASSPGTDWYRAPWGYRLALFAAVLGGARILYHSLDNLLAGRFGADLALTTACLAAIALGEHQTAGLVVFISLIGEAIEGFTLQQAKRAIRRTFEQRPQMATLIRDGLEREVPLAELQPGDRVLVRAGDRIPADGRIVAGASAINESPFTGESLPVDKTVNDPVLAGAINLTAALTVAVERTGENTSLAEMERLVKQATSRKMNCERLADRFAKWFLPAVFGLAAITLLGWRWQTGTWQAGWLPALGVLVVACPCPLVLATPCAVTAALAWLARRGIVTKGSATLERLAKVDVFAFDKTGTLSEGDLSLGEIVPFVEFSTDDLLQLAASAERPSNHPIARLLRTTAAKQKLAVVWPEDFTAHIAAGVSARVALSPLSPGGRGAGGDGNVTDAANEVVPTAVSVTSPSSGLRPPSPSRGEGESHTLSHQVLVGSERLLREHGGEIPPAASEALARLVSDGQSPLLIAVDGRLAGAIGIQETMRPESAATLHELKQLGIRRFVLLTGDRLPPAQAAGRALGVFDQIAAEQSPADKAQWIAAAHAAGQHIAMVGDGVNDGPALAAAEVGLAVCRAGNELAGEAGDLLLLGDPLRPLPGLVRLSRALVENIRQSLSWFAIGVNGLGVLACSLGWLTPVWAALFHEVASLLVMLNAVRLLWFQDEPVTHAAATSSWSDTWERWGTRLSPGHLIAIVLQRWRTALQVAACGAIAVWLCSQIVLVRGDESVVVLRGGKYLTTLDPGWSWRWPWPLERLVLLKPEAVQAVAVGFRVGANSQTSKGGDLEWTSSHGEAGERAEESLYLTGDEVAVELTADVHWRIADVQCYVLSGGLRPDDAIRSAAEGVLRSVVASETLDNILGEHRAELEQRCLTQLRERVQGYNLGVEVTALHWLDVHPPRPVVDAYRQVSDAWEQREQAVNEAQALATRTLINCLGETALQRLESRHANGLPADWSLSDDDWKLLSTPTADGERLITGTAGAILLDAEAAAEKQRQLATGQAARLRSLLAATQDHPRLSRLHLYWTAAIEALGGKPFTLVDPALAGRRQLFLGDLPANVITLPMPPDATKSP